MTPPPRCASYLVPVAVPAGFSLLCRSLLAGDKFYGPLLSASDDLPFERLCTPGIAPVRNADIATGPADANFPVTPTLDSGYRTYNS